MTYILVILMLSILLLSCLISGYVYVRKLNNMIKEKNDSIRNFEITIGYAEMGLGLAKDEIDILKEEIKKLNSDNRLLIARLSKINNQFKNVKDYLSKD